MHKCVSLVLFCKNLKSKSDSFSHFVFFCLIEQTDLLHQLKNVKMISFVIHKLS